MSDWKEIAKKYFKSELEEFERLISGKGSNINIKRGANIVDYTDIEGDVRRRDLTINALFYDLDREEIVDLVGGIEDLKKNKIRTVGDPEERFDEDPLRKLRALRFQARLGGKMDSKLLAALKKYPSLTGVSSERIRDEFLKSIKTAKSTGQYMEMVDNIGFTNLILPGLKVRKPYPNENNPILFLAQILQDNELNSLSKKLNKLNYTADEIKNITFLISLKNFSPDAIVAYKKAQERTTLTDAEILSFGSTLGKNLKKFVDFNLSVSGNTAPTNLKGKEIGQWISDMEKNKYLNEAWAVKGNKVEKFITAKNIKFQGTKYDNIELETVRVDNTNQTVTLRALYPKNIFGKEIQVKFQTLRRGPFFKTDTAVSEMAKSDLKQIEKYADSKLSPEDIEFTHHFFQRVNDPRNGKEISVAELTGFFKRLAVHKNELLKFLKQYQEFVVKDKRSNINIPIVKTANKIIAKTIMRKPDFRTPNAILAFESLNESTTDGSIKSIIQVLKLSHQMGVYTDEVFPEIKDNILAGISGSYKLGMKKLPKDKQEKALGYYTAISKPLVNAKTVNQFIGALEEVEKVSNALVKRGLQESKFINWFKAIAKKGKEWWIANRMKILAFIIEIIVNIIIKLIFTIIGALLKTKVDVPKFKFGGGIGGGGGSSAKWESVITEPEYKFEDKIPGGLAGGLGLTDIAKLHNVSVDVLVGEFKKGISVEMEHTSDREIAKEITLDHLYEDPKYYTKLADIEEYVMYRTHKVYPKDKDAFKLYQEVVRRKTNENYQKYFNEIPNARSRSREYHLAHKYSVKEAFDNNIPVSVVSHYKNLEIIDGRMNESKGTISSITLNELIYDIINSSNPLNNKILLQCGGAYGHMAHPFDNEINLTFGQLKDIVKKALTGDLALTREKTDGQALAISWRDGKLIAARNKGHLKNRGAAALDINGVASKFRSRGELEKAYNFAMQDLSKAIKSLSDKQRDKIFKQGACFMNLEVIYPTSVNVIPYGQALLIFHGTMEYDEDGIAIGENKEAARMLAGMIKQINKDVQDNYTIQGPPVVKLPKNQELIKLQPKYLAMINKLQSEFGLSDNQGVAEYHQAWWSQFIEKNFPNIDEPIKAGLIKRWAFMDKSFRINTIGDQKLRAWAEQIDKQDHGKISKENIMKFEKIFLGVGSDVLQFMSSVLTVNPDKAKRDMIGRLEQTIKDVQSRGTEKQVDKLKLELKRLQDIGGFDKIVPLEGIVFQYPAGPDGKTFKLTGSFASVNQLLGIFFNE